MFSHDLAEDMHFQPEFHKTTVLSSVTDRQEFMMLVCLIVGDVFFDHNLVNGCLPGSSCIK